MKIILYISFPISFQLVHRFQNYPIAAVFPSRFTFDSISAIKFVNLVVPSPCETQPNNNNK